MRLACAPARRQRQCRSIETVSVRRDRAGPCGPAGLSYTIFPMLIKGLYHRSDTERFHTAPSMVFQICSGSGPMRWWCRPVRPGRLLPYPWR